MANQQDVSSGRSGNGEGSARGDRTGSGLSEKTHEAAEQMKSAVSGQIDQARQRAQSARDETAQRIHRVALQLQHASEVLQPDDQFVARLAQQASASIDKVADYVNSAEIRRLRSDAESFARARPAVFFSGAFVLGLALGRFLKGSAASSSNGGSSNGGRNGRSDFRTQGSSTTLGQWNTNSGAAGERDRNGDAP